MEKIKTFSGDKLNQLLDIVNEGATGSLLTEESRPEEILVALEQKLKNSNATILPTSVIGNQARGAFSIMEEIKRQVNSIEALDGTMFEPTPDGTTYEAESVEISRHLLPQLREEYMGNLDLGEFANDLELKTVMGLKINSTSLSHFNGVGLGFPIRVTMKAITPEADSQGTNEISNGEVADEN